jgi:hypothetical protein
MSGLLNAAQLADVENWLGVCGTHPEGDYRTPMLALWNHMLALTAENERLTAELHHERTGECPSCQGRGIIDNADHRCGGCSGKGYLVSPLEAERDALQARLGAVQAIEWPTGTEAVQATPLGQSIHKTMRRLCQEAVARALRGAG